MLSEYPAFETKVSDIPPPFRTSSPRIRPRPRESREPEKAAFL